MAAPADRSLGTWRNPKNTVHVRAEHCGRRICGVVVWANDKAKADARKGGTDPLVGSRLFKDFVPDKPGVWRGRIFVPDIGQTFSGTITMLDDRRIEGSGCLLRRVGCRSQIWTRIE
ncbi:DUF2147 domain-containing protein [Sphingobium yanoikuyae]|uniref:DUF2147 domain-containing protein n=3 Tax=Sphingobium TaxID=165695 RepID=A0A5B8CCJ9_SPHSA|nr:MULTISPECIES: DUF2147 domain-containing protein [Sphingobium]QDC36555.1 DUF2147 domain-containing protein [Sphingobium fuliginis ATCC 27551]QNG43957.1 DUF2147 domain-containing protein [Sphingobium yanoikuyae]